MASITSITAGKSMPEALPMCELCETNKAALQCLSCKIGQKLCASCYKVTHHGDNKRAHQIQLFSSTSETVVSSYTQALSMLTMEYFCDVHSKKALEYVCKLCDCVICCDCLLVGEHKGHDAVGFEEACQKVYTNYKSLLIKEQEQQTRLKEIKQIIGQKVKKREEKYKIWSETVAAEFRKMCEALKAKEKAVMLSIDEEKQREFRGYEKMCEEMEKAQKENVDEVERIQEAVSKKISPLAYKAAKGETLSEGKEYKVDVITPFENNKKLAINVEEILNGINNLAVFIRASDSLPKVPAPTKVAR